jgi:hypothetical protein
MRAITDQYLPMAEIRRAFHRFLRLSLKNSRPANESPFHSMATWPDALQMLQPYITNPDPAALLHRLMIDESFRIGFLFALFLPNRHGEDSNVTPGKRSFSARG